MKSIMLAVAVLVASSPLQARDAGEVRDFRKENACPSTGKLGYRDACPGWVVDHGIPLCAGGADDDKTNMFWQEKAASYKKDKHERRLCREIRRLLDENKKLKENAK